LIYPLHSHFINSNAAASTATMLCCRCKEITLDHIVWDTYASTNHNSTTLEISAQAGCELCKLFCQELLQDGSATEARTAESQDLIISLAFWPFVYARSEIFDNYDILEAKMGSKVAYFDLFSEGPREVQGIKDQLSAL